MGLEDYGKQDRGRYKIAIMVVIAAVVLLGGSGIGFYLYSRKNNTDPGDFGASLSLVQQRQAVMKKLADEAVAAPCAPADPKKQASVAAKASLISLLAQPKQAGAYFGPLLLGKARLELYQVATKDVYFSLPPSDSSGEKLAQAMCQLAVNKSRVEAGEEEQGKFWFRDYSFLRTMDKAAFFRVPLENVRVDADAALRFPFDKATYAPTPDELHDFMTNNSVFGGPFEALPDSASYGQVLYNYGTVVAKPGERSLQRFVNDLTKDIAASDADAREKKVQRLADLVSREIAPNPEEIALNVIKRPSESLITGKADYPNKAVLLAALLEQMQEDYLLVYAKDFLAVAVKRGRFPATNEYQIKWENADYLLIDATRPGFRVGQDKPKAVPGRPRYVQKPGQQSAIVNAATGKSLSFKLN